MPDVIDTYEGELCVKCVHVGSQASIMAESKIRDFGSHNSFSPVDLLSAAVGSCALNTMGYYAHRHNIDINGAEADVTLSMSGATITAIEVVFRLPARGYADSEKQALENSARSCPVHKCISSDVQQTLKFVWL